MLALTFSRKFESSNWRGGTTSLYFQVNYGIMDGWLSKLCMTREFMDL